MHQNCTRKLYQKIVPENCTRQLYQKMYQTYTLYQKLYKTLYHPKNTPFIVDRTTIQSPIQRFESLMRISFKFNTTQYIFYGILKRSSMYAKNMDTPLINKKMEYIFNERHFLPGSYDYNEVIRIFMNFFGL